MNSEKQFKQSLGSLLDSKEFVYDAANWANAEKMLLANKRRKALWIAFSSSVVFLTGLLFFITYNAENLILSFEFAIKNGGIKNKENSFYTDNNNGFKKENEKNNLNFNVQKIESSIPEKNKVETEKINKIIPITNTTKVKDGLTSTIENKETKASLILEKEKNVSYNEGENKVSDVTSSPKLKSPEKSLKNAENSLENSLNEDYIITTKNTTTISKEKNNSSLANKNKIESSENALPNLVTTENKVKENSTIYLPQLQFSFETSDEKEITPSLLNINNNYPKPEFKKARFLALEVGSIFTLGWKNSDIKEGNGFNPLIGIHYVHQFSKPLLASVGLQYSSLGNLNFSSHTSKITRYGIGETNTVTTITPTKLQFLILPLHLHFNINPANTIGMGVNIAYLLTSNSKIETYTENYNGTKSNFEKTKSKGYTEGFKTYDTQLSFFYKRALYRNICVMAELKSGLTDIKDNTFFKSNKYERNYGIKLSLVYHLFYNKKIR